MCSLGAIAVDFMENMGLNRKNRRKKPWKHSTVHRIKEVKT